MDRLKLSLAFDPDRLQEDLHRCTQVEWIDHFVRQNYEGEWRILPLRGPTAAQHPIQMIYSDPTCEDFSDTPFLAECSYFKTVLNSFACPLHSVRLMNLTAGSEIKEHSDYDLSLEDGKVRLHLPIVTNPGVEFVLNNRRVEMLPGECWYLRLADPHRVANRGNVNRIHLVIDAVVNNWLQKLFAESS